MTTTTCSSSRSSLLVARIALVASAGALVAVASSAGAAPRCHPVDEQRVETLEVAVVAMPTTVSRGVTVEVHVLREPVAGVGARDRVAGATVSLRLTAGAVTTHVWGHTDERGSATMRLTPAGGTPTGPATISAEAWSTPVDPTKCGPLVEEHGLVEHGTRVTR